MEMKYDTTVDLPANVTDLESAYNWIGNNIEYRSDFEVWNTVEYWQSPTTTLEKGTGDCEDFAILFSAFAQELGYRTCEVAIVFKENDGHAVSCIDGNWYDPTPVLNSSGVGHHADKFETIKQDFEIDYCEDIDTVRARCYRLYNN